MTDLAIILTTCGSQETAQTIAEALVDKALAASVTVIPRAKSYFAFHGTTRWDEEFQLLVYTTENRYEAVEQEIIRLHTYEVPEVFMLGVARGAEDCLAWIRGMGRK
jgi:periplasmic divalent cation tolerance protein